MNPGLVVLVMALGCSIANAADVRAKPSAATGIASADGRTPARGNAIHAVTAPGPGQAGYVHYFLITHPNGELEYQVGIEMEDQRIAWSFPEAGVMVSAFVGKGPLNVKGQLFQIEHLYGIRPFASRAEMRDLQHALPRRVAQWIDDETPYCVIREPGQIFCLNCGDFVVRILFPGTHPLIPALPQALLRVTGSRASADELLLHLAGLHDLPGSRAMHARLASLDLPATLRDDLQAMIDGMDHGAQTAATPIAPAQNQTQASTLNPAAGKRIALRRIQGKKL